MSEIKPFLDQTPFDEGSLPVSPIHTLSYTQYGLPTGKPAIFLHGGPGGSTGSWAAQYFDPTIYRIVMFDQRGSGKSTPLGELRENTTADCLSDIEAIRRHLGIAKWHCVWGGSWGSTLALLYAQKHAERVGSLVIRGVWALTQEEFRVTFEFMRTLWPDVWEVTMGYLSEEERRDVFAAYYRRMTTGTRESQVEAAKKYTYFPVMLSQLIPPPEGIALLDHEDPDVLLAASRVNVLYMVEAGWLKDGQIMEPENMKKIEHITTAIVNGRYDMMCPTFTAYRVHKALPNSKLYIIEGRGHTANDSDIREKLIEVTSGFGKRNF